ncbi:MAG: hypothetical protein A3K60_00095 [Euryarchaeota archaeon RBG_19FT_COMBO_56_21]|nr:MAG: hypothetical protein A3K60_00095 [Euryarchaeota archaeon RBG_19FT_COMBO_56_21]
MMLATSISGNERASIDIGRLETHFVHLGETRARPHQNRIQPTVKSRVALLMLNRRHVPAIRSGLTVRKDHKGGKMIHVEK